MTRRRAALLFLLVLLLRFSISAQFRGNYDTGSFLIVGDAVLHGKNVYDATDRYNYSPLWAYVLALLWAVARPSVGIFVLLVGLLQTAIDVVTAFVVLRIARRRLGLSPPGARRAALLFFSNPVAVLVSGAHGQFDGASILFLLAAIFVATGPELKKDQWRVASLLGLSLIVKHLTLFHPLLFWKRIRRPGLSDAAFVAPYTLFLVSFLPFAGAWRAILRNVFLYSAAATPGVARPGGLQAYVTLPGVPRAAFGVIFVLAAAWVVFATRKEELSRSCLLLSLAALVFLPNYADQYLVWPVALGALYPSTAFGLFSAAAGLWYSWGSLHLPLPIRTDAQAAWVMALLWFGAEASAAARPPTRSINLATMPAKESRGDP